ncbi:MAG: DNA/RNA nuclease SfsA [Tissierellia bacterium]|nr:DNA/RNA nuclease SfsA [Tissierellia bacterium]
MKYGKVIEAIFLKRPNRFIAHVLIHGEEEIVHVRNTGRCKELLIPGAKVVLEDCSHNLNRKTKYSLIAVWKDEMLVNMDSQIPNAAVFNAINENRILGLQNLSHLKREVTFGNSRFDIYFESNKDKGFVEIKGVTLEQDSIAMFPDAPTDRGAKHVLEMIEAVKQGYRGIIFFLLQMKGPKSFMPNYNMDKVFSNTLKLASENGVEILVYDSIISNNCIIVDKPVIMESLI